MNILHKYFTLLFVFALLILSSCQKENLYDEPENNSFTKEIDTRAFNSLTAMCTTSRDCITADPFGGCLILFPPEPADPDFGIDMAVGSAFVNQNGNLTFHLYSKLGLPEESQNTQEDFQISNMVVPPDVAEELYGSSSPGEIILIEGNYDAEVADNFLALSVPSNVGEVEITIWYTGE